MDWTPWRIERSSCCWESNSVLQFLQSYRKFTLTHHSALFFLSVYGWRFIGNSLLFCRPTNLRTPGSPCSETCHQCRIGCKGIIYYTYFNHANHLPSIAPLWSVLRDCITATFIWKTNLAILTQPANFTHTHTCQGHCLWGGLQKACLYVLLRLECMDQTYTTRSTS